MIVIITRGTVLVERKPPPIIVYNSTTFNFGQILRSRITLVNLTFWLTFTFTFESFP